jgi:hypothetical protein
MGDGSASRVAQGRGPRSGPLGDGVVLCHAAVPPLVRAPLPHLPEGRTDTAACFFKRLRRVVFVTYGVLDAFSQIVAEVAEVQTKREIKFPLIACILTEDSCQPERWDRFKHWIEQVYRSPWYIEVRRLRNVINYGSVLSAPLGHQRPIVCRSGWRAMIGLLRQLNKA